MNKSWSKRGRGARLPISTNNNSAGVRQDNKARSSKTSAHVRFKNASEKHGKDVKQALQSFEDYYQSSSEEEDLNDVGILSKTIKQYNGLQLFNGDNNDLSSGDTNLGNTTQYLMECCQSGALTCLVCISSIKRQNSVWSCEKCFAMFHLNCIKQWVLEGIAQATLLSDKYFPNREQPWFCPKCRNEYSRSKCPESYFCFCGSQRDPPSNPWILPHSCGETCNKQLKNPVCNHRCLLLCHPGPCPPCPQVIDIACHCGKQAPTPRRCGSGKWSCGQTCLELLSCKRHKCQMICHEGECPPCTQRSMQPCICGAQTKIQSCAQPRWSCENACNNLLPCGRHRCDKICHKPGECGECPTSGIRTCPCGKKRFEDLRCDEEVKTCEDTCGKSLGCDGKHTCPRKCHFGPCGSCPLVAVKSCRCGKHKRELPCRKEYICETRCTKTRSCGKHPCKRKCCTGQCPPCEQVCSRMLQCKKHKCQMLCHQGPCYPCPLTTKVSCKCGGTSITVVCGKEKTTKPPKCRMPCMIPSNCHHPQRIKHYCHFGDCPKCNQICNQTLQCGHICPATCHDNVLIKNQEKALAPWEMPQEIYQVKKLPCPPCQVPVPVTCRGGHETSDFPCSEAREHSCGRECGRLLSCGNHKCSILCHVVEGAKDDVTASTNCASCEEPCTKPRLPGCEHECISSCHSGDCPPCRKRIKKRCHCGMVVIKHLCCEWSGKSQEEYDRMTSCGSNCPKTLSCGHICSYLCHPGECSPPEECKKKVILRCPCKRKKKDFICSLVSTQNIKVVCDDKCEDVKAARAAEKAEEERRSKEEEQRKQLEEVEKFERKLHKRSRVQKRRKSTDEKQQSKLCNLLSSYRTYILFIVFAMIALAFSYYQTTLD